MEHREDVFTQAIRAKHHLQAAIVLLETLRPHAEMAEMDMSAVLAAMDLERSAEETNPLGTLIDHLKAELSRGGRLGILPPDYPTRGCGPQEARG